MSVRVYEDRWCRQIVQFAHVDGPKLEIWAQPWRLTPNEALEIGKVLTQWAAKHRDQYSEPNFRWSQPKS